MDWGFYFPASTPAKQNARWGGSQQFRLLKVGWQRGGGVCVEVNNWGPDTPEVKQNEAFTRPILGKMLQLLPFLYITPTVSFATLFEPILKMARPPNNWHSAFIIWGTCCQFDNKTILRRERLSSHCPASLFVCDTNRQQLETLSSSKTHHASQI